jgi:hypothetical protein
MMGKYIYSLGSTEILTTLLILAGTRNRATMGNPSRAMPMFKFNLMSELGRAMHRAKDSTQLIIGEWHR